MKNLLFLTTLVYAVSAIYCTYIAVLHIYIIIANYFLGHSTPKGPALGYTIGAFVTIFLTYQGYLILFQSIESSWRKWILFSPIMVLVLYGMWALLIIISAGGRWN